MFAKNPVLSQFFVPGSDAFLTANINPRLGLANGSPVTCHSLVLDPNSSDFERVNAILSGANPLPFGSEIFLDSPPIAVNMKVGFGLDGKKLSAAKKEQLVIILLFKNIIQ